MAKGRDGVWSITIGPLPPEIWIYNFRIRGVDLPDPANISLMPRAAGTASSSFVEVPGDGRRFYDARPVPARRRAHGRCTSRRRWAWIATSGSTRRRVTTSRDANIRFIYLLHGNGETQSGWVANGRANIILDNLIADGKAVPMIVVMPHGHPIQSASVGPFVEVPLEGGAPGLRNYTLFTKTCWSKSSRWWRRTIAFTRTPTIARSAGCRWELCRVVAIGIAHPELFHYVLAYSGGFGSLGVENASPDATTQSPWKGSLRIPARQVSRSDSCILVAASPKPECWNPARSWRPC